MNAQLEAAPAYAGLGWPVIPVHFERDGHCSCGKTDCQSAGKHPITQHGVKDASSDAAQIKRWWTENPGANIGVATGARSGIIAIDVDPRHGGTESLEQLLEEHSELPPSIESLTGGGGRHLIFAHPGGRLGNRSNIRPGIDVRGDGGYIVAPPSNHASGNRYAWREGHSPQQIKLAQMPGWLLRLARPPRQPPASHASNGVTTRPTFAMDAHAERALRAMRSLRVDDHADGSKRLYIAASIAVKHDLSDAVALQVIRAYLAEHPTPRDYSDDEILQRVCDAEKKDQRGCAMQSKPETATLRNGEPVLTCLADIEPKEVDWLWRDRIPLGRITLLVGKPGEGKSFLTLDISAHVTTGRRFIDGSECPRGSVILICGEDDPADTVRPRLDAHMADVAKVQLLTAVRWKKEDGSPHEVMFTLEDIPALERALKLHEDCRLVVIDPIGSYLGKSADAHRDNEVRGILAPVAMLAEKHGVAILIVAHRRKSSSESADDLALGSRAFTGIARAVWHLQRDPDDKRRRLLLPGKQNLAAETTGLAFAIRGEPPVVAWETTAVAMTADEALAKEIQAAQKKRGPVPAARKAAIEWLRDRLQGGPVDVANVLEQAKAAGFSWSTIQRAADQLDVTRRKDPGGPWRWGLLAEDSRFASQDPTDPKNLRSWNAPVTPTSQSSCEYHSEPNLKISNPPHQPGTLNADDGWGRL